MDPTAISRWLSQVMDTPNVNGALLVEASTGICLGASGKATEDDATYLVVASRDGLDADGVGAVVYKDSKVLIRKGDGVLVAVFMDL
ncbi:uncharacterized protein H6S33_009106 [Morchella sextelata]|uniref:uncharacterized protein n=1 Tax=Morchella sextelata TaxID=1174677 RepID=UPI001D03AB0A|nr:uncharacterized protein H6S33_009106 [Morchella sextelata]KAH0612726.1 hypothetical protein H6S33_009106 [Morchella sextelata]